MELLYLLESIRNPVLNAIVSVITYLGGETVFIVVALLFFWCIDKRKGYYILSVCFMGTIINQFLKLMFRIPRPWVKDPEFTIVEAARSGATGYSFPSGHTQNVTGYLGSIARTSKRRIVRIISVVLILLTAFSRMYLGVHTPLDVGVSLAVGTVLVFVLYPIYRKSDNPKFLYGLLIVMFAVAAGFTLFAELHPWPSDMDATNLASGIKNGWTLTGCSLGMLVACAFDEKKLHFDTKAPVLGQIIKVVLGLGIAMLIKSGLKAPLNTLFNGFGIAHGVRYFIMVIFAAGIWPMAFPFIVKITSKSKR